MNWSIRRRDSQYRTRIYFLRSVGADWRLYVVRQKNGVSEREIVPNLACFFRARDPKQHRVDLRD